MVTVRVLDSAGNVKRREAGLLRRLLGLPGRLMEQRFHNIVTRQGDALIADALLQTPSKAKVGSNGYIQVGTGWNNYNVKENLMCNYPTGSMKHLDNGYPQLQASFGNFGDNTVQYRATFEAGSLNDYNINEAALMNGNGTNANCLAYAQIVPAVNVTSADTLQILWEITIMGQ
jgi:hypothetical protein